MLNVVIRYICVYVYIYIYTIKKLFDFGKKYDLDVFCKIHTNTSIIIIVTTWRF